MNRETDYAWAAGLIDGEGCLRIYRIDPRKWAQRPSYGADIRVAMASAEAVKRLRDIFKLGTVKPKKKPKHSHLALWCWRVGANEVASVIPLIRPYLVVKACEADLLMEIATRKKFRGDMRSFSEKDKMAQQIKSEALFMQCRQFKSAKGGARKATR